MASKKADGKMTKTDAVKAAMADGVDNPTEGAAYIKTKFGLDITPQVFSTTKSIAKKKAAETNGHAGAGNNGTSVPKVSKKVASAGTGVDDAAALARGVKQLVEQYGAAAVKNMADVFGE